jgi:hypothetical protein
MTTTSSPARARAEAVFKASTPNGVSGPMVTKLQQSAMDEYHAKQAAEREKMARLRAMRMAAGRKRS